MSIVPDSCPSCGEPITSFAHWDWHKRVDHLREYEPCEACGQWDDERTQPGPGGWLHDGCSDQLAADAAAVHIERQEGAA